MTSIKNTWAILAQSSSVDKDNNTLSLFEILEEVTFQISGSLPEKVVFPINSQLVSFWEREQVGEKLELKVKIVLRDPKGQVLGENEGVVKLEPQHKRSRFRAVFQGLPVTGPGVYHYEVVSLEPQKTEGKELLSSIALEVKITGQPTKSPIIL